MKSTSEFDGGIASFHEYRDVEGQYTDDFIKSSGALKLSEEGGVVSVAVRKSGASEAKRLVSEFHKGMEIRFLECADGEFEEFVGSVIEKGHKKGEKAGVIGSGEFRLEDTSESSVVNIINSIVIEAARSGATDVHIEPAFGEARVRFRIDGLLRTVRTLAAGAFPNLAGRIKVMGGMNIMESRLPQDGHMQAVAGGRKLDIRCSTMPVQGGESIVLRLFDNSERVPPLRELGFSDADAERLEEVARLPYGLVLFTGPTGSGKSTTMHSLLSTLNGDERKIMTIEDPVERRLDGVCQIQTAEGIGLTFESALRRILRQDPDVIMIGEIRDGETARLAVRAAMTGHLIFATLHANSGEESAARLESMGADPFLVKSVLRMCVSQRLVRKVCVSCKEKTSVPERYVKYKSRFGSKTKVVRGSGCPECGGTGYKGRTVINGIYIPECDGGKSVTTLLQSGLEKAFAGVTSFGELEREGVF